jgi:hypothetical protein
MASTWDALRAHVCTKFHIAVREETRLGLLWRFEGLNAPQRQWVEVLDAFGKPHVVISCNVGTASSMTCYDALIHNAQLAIGALCFHEGHLVLRMVLPLEGVDIHVIESSLGLLASEAVRLRTKETPKAAPAPYYE